MNEATLAKIKKTAGIVLNTLIVLFVIFAVVITVMVFAAQNNENGVPELFGRSWLTVETESMEPIFKPGDLIFMEVLDAEAKDTLKVGDIVTYKAPIDINGDGYTGDINTHRIYSIEDGIIRTKGDHNTTPDGYTITKSSIIGKCYEDDRIGGVGGVLSFLRSSLGFFICIVLPLILFFVYELYKFIALIVSERAKAAPVSKETEEEIKRRAIEEYLKSHSAEDTENKGDGEGKE